VKVPAYRLVLSAAIVALGLAGIAHTLLNLHAGLATLASARLAIVMYALVVIFGTLSFVLRLRLRV
jgi:hypothetical protein